VNDFPDNTSEADAQAVSEPARPGELLRRARESHGLEVADVVQAIKFSHRQIEALEADDLAALPGMVFVRGIVRSYARFLKMAPEPLLAMLETEAPVEPPDVRPPDNMGTAMPRTGVRQIPLLVALSVLLLIGAATMAAWHFLVPVPAAAPVAVATGDTTLTVSAPQPRVESAADAAGSAPVTPPVTPALPPVDSHQLVFEFRGRSWVEVKDASQRIILTGQYAAGAREAVTGQPPFQLVIGNAAEVVLQYDDRSVDLKPHTRAEVARLTLE
jgi:cytoskeleton protein RodZ